MHGDVRELEKSYFYIEALGVSSAREGLHDSRWQATMTKYKAVITVVNIHSMNSEEGRSAWGGEVREGFLEELRLELAHEG